jgi:hypothetical protein
LFVLHLVRGDQRRAAEEQQKGNLPASRAFWLAFLFDGADVALHAIIISSVLQSAYGIGPVLPHAWLHAAEWGGVAVAAASTVAAVVGEMLAAGAFRWRGRRTAQPPGKLS